MHFKLTYSNIVHHMLSKTILIDVKLEGQGGFSCSQYEY